ncbi:MAG: galactosyldiacylglycerol synthase, partial [Planctomycetes bacterium]|nr:galactosyldiacylglycerol synthase [Planctomycetota bacterium]
MARLLLLFADTGGGHRSAAEALLEAWQAEHPGRVKAEMVDLFRDYSPFPYRIADRTYPFSIKYCQGIYSATFRGSNGPRRVWVIARVSYNYVRPYLRRLLTEHPADVVVSLHPFFNHWVGWGLRDLGLHVPFLTVVTDLWTGHASWYYPHAHGIIVPTEEARARALRYGIAPERVWVRGLPVARKFTTNL